MKKLMLGNEAFARGAYEAGVTVAAAYPGTPSTEITENIAKLSGSIRGVVTQQKVALEVAIGASIGGARALCCMKHVGLNVAAPACLPYLTPVSTAGCDHHRGRPGHTFQPERAGFPFYAQRARNDAGAFRQHGSQGVCESGIRAFEQFDMPVLVRLQHPLSHSQG